MKRSMLGAVACAAMLLSYAESGHAQTVGGFSLNQYEPTPAGDLFFGVPGPQASGHLDVRGQVGVNFASKPIRRTDQEVSVVSDQLLLNAAVSFALWDRLLLSLDMPLSVAQSGDDTGVSGVTFTPLEAPQPGDLRIGARGRAYGDEASVFQIGGGGYLFVPTGNQEQYTGDGSLRGDLHVSAGGRIGDEVSFVYTASGGFQFRGSAAPHQINFGAGVGALLLEDMLQFGVEAAGTVPLSGDVTLSGSGGAVTSSLSPGAHLLVGAKGRFLDGLTVGAGAGPGLGGSLGTPTFRVVGLVGWAPIAHPKKKKEGPVGPSPESRDTDQDGINDKLDACPMEAGEPNADPKLDGCPPPDEDKDGILDVDDACPSTKGVRNTDITKNGCPLDTDGDTIFDVDDACPEVKGIAHEDKKRNGCPSDRDEDGIVDVSDACPDDVGAKHDNPQFNGCPEDPDKDGIRFGLDACPNVKGVPDSDPKKNGCPQFIDVTKGEIKIKQKIEFETYGASLRESVSSNSEKLLLEVRDAIMAPDIELVEVQGHTDDSGSEKFNMELSTKRAEKVRQWMIDHGVPPERVVARGYGFTRPVADNRTRTGRQANRRVQFVIIKRRDKKKKK